MAGEILTEMVECPVTDSPAVPGYLARPEGDGPFPAIVVIQEWWGLEPHIKDIAERFAREGYAALAPDLYHGAVTDEPDEARKLAMETDMDLAVREVGGAVTYLRGQPYAKGTVATIGYCMGGGLSLSASCRYPVDATIVYYGGNPNPLEQVQDIPGPVLGIYGEDDRLFPDAVNALREALTGYGKTVEIHTYPGAPHAFFNDSRPPTYWEEASKDAWQKTLDFLARNMS
jgi:carboxymethylenebutenolidase